ncbi:UAA transporter [Pisolithus orientalis]|uniref:UAA transporter n=1 Tax=Pisolithus orientalis TaxID=936130 RepID=UPI00222519C9|nr:UAA transporter [Pisolithus orientalis]KAI6035610.1 UAA transporter [Pisolithus orientalis]
MLSLADWVTTLTLIFGGCCSNAITMEHVTSTYPHSGVLVTFFQFLIVFLYGLPSQLTFTRPETLQAANRGSEVPLLPYLIQVALFFVLSTLNNAAFAYHIPMDGRLLAKKRYTFRQVMSVLVVTVGIVLTTLSASKPQNKGTTTQTAEVSLYAQGIAILSLALLLSGFLGLVQDWPPPILTSSQSWQENMFFLHTLALPLFFFSKDNIVGELSRMNVSAPVSSCTIPSGMQHYIPTYALTIPSIFIYLFLNTITQLLCVMGVNRLTGRVTSLTVTLILAVRKAVSLLLSVAVYGRQANAAMWAGAALVFLGTIGYSTGSRSKHVKDKED